MRNSIRYIFGLLFLAILFSACSNVKHLPEGETLFRGSKVKITDREAPKSERKVLSSDMVGVVRPRPNTKTLGMRIKLGLYNMGGGGDADSKKGIKKFLVKSGEPPVIGSSVNLDLSKELMVNMLHNRGFFQATATAKWDTARKKKTTAMFEVATGPQYTINKTFYVRPDSSEISHDIDSSFSKTLLSAGAPYNLDLVKAERNRIDNVLKNQGFFFFKPDYILVKVDSSIGDHKVNMYVTLKDEEIPDEAYNVYRINDVFIYANYRLRGSRQDTSKAVVDTIDGYKIIDRRRSFKPMVFSDALIFERGEEYNIDDQNTTLSRLVNMGTFKFVKNRFEAQGNTLLDVYYYLTPYPKKSIRFEAGVLTQNDNRLGTQGSISWRNRNTFKGAEELLFKINGGFEAQSTGVVNSPAILNYGAEAALSFPRFVVPFISIHTLSRYLPRSVIKLKYNYETQVGRVAISSYTGAYGYSWKEGVHKEHQFYPVNLTYVRTDTLAKSGDLNLLYRNILFNGLIIGPTYEYTYNSNTGSLIRNSYYFDGLIDLSGNVLGLAQKADYKSNPQEILGVTYAQYVKLQPDFRYYFHLSAGSMIASRVLVGLGIPYGNSSQLPNIKQFWAGGNSDLRGFPSRLVGPGTFNEYSLYKTTNYIQSLGDIKFEINTELRQKLYKFIGLGVFAEAGNIWLYRKNALFPGGEFTSDFYKQLAADVGLGLRFDFKILLLRLDMGIPVRKPWVTANGGWGTNNVASDMVFNLAIGYPF